MNRNFYESRYAHAALVFVAAFAVYANSIANGFVYDDKYLVIGNPWIKDVRHIPDFFLSDSWGFMDTASNYYRPVMLLAYMVDYHIFGLEPWGFHLSYVLMHSLVSVAAFFFAARVMALTRSGDRPVATPPVVVPMAAAVLYAVHPIHTQVVAWNGIHEMSLAFFCMLSFIFYTGARRLPALLCFAAALLSKETAVVLPVLLVAYDLTMNRVEYLARRAAAAMALARSFAPYVALGCGYLLLRGYAIGGFSPSSARSNLGLYDYVLNLPVLFTGYLYKLLIPTGLTPTHVFHQKTAFLDVTVLFSMTVVVAFALAMSVSFKRSPAVFQCLVWIAVPLAPVMYLPAMGPSVFAENYLYLPSIGFSILTALALVRLARYTKTAAISAFVTLTLIYSVAAIDRNAVWRDDLTLWTDTVKKSPDSFIAVNNLGEAYAKRGRIDEAIELYKAAAGMSHGAAVSNINLGIAYYNLGRYDDSIDSYLAALKMNPRFISARLNLGGAYMKKGLFAEAEAEFKEVIKISPDLAEGYNSLGIVYKELGRPAAAAAEFKRAASLGAGGESSYNLGVIYMTQGLASEAEKSFEEALRRDPSHAGARSNLGALYAGAGRLQEALGELTGAVELDPDLVEAHNNLGNVNAMLGRVEEAIKEYEQVVSLDGEHVGAYFNLGLMYGRTGRIAEARRAFERVLELNPGDEGARRMLEGT